MKKIVPITTIGATLLCGCGKQSIQTTSNFDIVVTTNANARIYEINRTNGTGIVIYGNEYTFLRPSDLIMLHTNTLMDWGKVAVGSESNQLSFALKTKWKDGMIHFVVSVVPYEGFLENQFVLAKSSQKSDANFESALAKQYPANHAATSAWDDFVKNDPSWASSSDSFRQIDLYFYDEDGFKQQMIRIPLAEMEIGKDEKGNKVLTIDRIDACTHEDYLSFKNWGAGWSNFQ